MEKIIVKSLVKKMKNDTILNNISLELESGKIYGFIGKNGSGKTMFFRTLIGLIKPTSGKIVIDDKELYKDIDFLPSVGIVIENIGLYPEYTGFTNLKFLSRVKNICSDEDINNAIKRVGLDPKDKKTVKKYSLGMRQRIVLAQALMENPEVLVLDEPTNALDESGIELLHSILKEEKKKGKIILLASHSREDIEKLCDKTFTLKDGKIIDKD